MNRFGASFGPTIHELFPCRELWRLKPVMANAPMATLEHAE
jgi:hypothetical protein